MLTAELNRRPTATTGPALPDPEVMEAVLGCFATPDTAICVTDENDDIRYASPAFCRAFIPHYDGRRSNFMATLETAIRAGSGIKLVSAPPRNFARAISERRREQVGTFSFATDLCDGSWWWVTDVKLPSGWMVCVSQDISSLKSEEMRLRDARDSAIQEAQTDSLTGVASRRWGLKQAEAAVEAAVATGRPLSIALIDFDNFKPINDTYGHETGDRALAHFARHMAAAVGNDGQFSRLGGDEFLLLMPDATLDMLYVALASALKSLPGLPCPGAGPDLRISVSGGAAQLRPDDRWATLLPRADAALYTAKAGGRGRIACAP